jgi:hypothetical protein
VAESEGFTSKADMKVFIQRMGESEPTINVQSIKQKKSQSFMSPSKPLINDCSTSEVKEQVVQTTKSSKKSLEGSVKDRPVLK